MRRWQAIPLVLACLSCMPSALADCLEPLTPACAERADEFSDQYEFKKCRQQMAMFHKETKEYLLCLKRSVGPALEHFNEAVDSFNKRAHNADSTALRKSTGEEMY